VRLIFDIETDNLLDKVTKLHSLVIKDVDSGDQLSCYHGNGQCSNEVGLALLKQADELIGHNILTYDLPVLEKLVGFRPKAGCKITDTLVCSRLIWSDIKPKDIEAWKRNRFPGAMIGKHSLKAWGYRLGVLKGVFHETADWSVWTPEMQQYCEQDVEVTFALWSRIVEKNYSAEAIQLEHDFQRIIFQQEQFGFRFDEQAAGELYAKLAQRRTELTQQLQAIFPPTVTEMKTPAYWTGVLRRLGEMDAGEERFATKTAAVRAKARDVRPGLLKQKSVPFNPGSRQQIAARLIERGWTPSKFTDGGDPQIDESVLDEIGTAEAKLLNEYLLVEKRVGQIAEGDEAWLKLVRNGRIHGRVITNGAVTGRCTHMKPNVSQTPAVYSPYGKECRACYVADEGHNLVGADASGLELRMFAHYLAFYDGGEYGKVVTSGDIHTANQKLAGLPTRDNAKTFIYALLYGAGDAKIGKIIGGTAEEGAVLRSKFMRGLPAYAKLARDIKKAVKDHGHLRGIDGRLLNIRSQHSALNTLLQSAGALVVKKATVLLIDKLTALGFTFGKEYALVAHIHDELQLQVRHGLEEQVGRLAVESIEEAGRHFKFRVPLTGEFKAGRNWAETH
jgi:DNA polymerase-1